MKDTAISVFRRPPERLNCAQSVYYAWIKSNGGDAAKLGELKSCGGGRAPGGLCGAIYAACLVVPEKEQPLQADFESRLGSKYCAELRADKKHPCEACVALAAELLLAQARSPVATPAFRTAQNETSGVNPNEP
jgi:hypothetical protein